MKFLTNVCFASVTMAIHILLHLLLTPIRCAYLCTYTYQSEIGTCLELKHRFRIIFPKNESINEPFLADPGGHNNRLNHNELDASFWCKCNSRLGLFLYSLFFCFAFYRVYQDPAKRPHTRRPLTKSLFSFAIRSTAPSGLVDLKNPSLCSYFL